MSRPRPPSYNFEKFKKRLNTMEIAKNRFDTLDEHRKKNEVANIYIALEAFIFLPYLRPSIEFHREVENR